MGMIEGPGRSENERQSDAERLYAIESYHQLVEEQETWLAILVLHLRTLSNELPAPMQRPWQLAIDRTYAEALRDVLGNRPTVVSNYDIIRDCYLLEIC